MEEVVLVDEHDRPIGRGEKIETHLRPRLHRAFSVFVFDSSWRLLLQKRARAKYHSGELWSNTCCSHPRPGEPTETAARRRLKEEMGFDCEVTKVFDFIYYAELERGIVEHEYDHVFAGWYDGSPTPDPCEVEDWKWVEVQALAEDLRVSPHIYSYWLRASFEELLRRLQVPAATADVVLSSEGLCLTERSEGRSVWQKSCWHHPPPAVIEGYANNLSDSPGREEPDPAPLCRWCGKAFTKEEARARVRVCESCVRLLTGTGISDEEIYGPTDEDEEKS